MRALRPRVFLVGFSTGGALALMLAARALESLEGVVAVSVPIKFQNKNMVFVPLMHRANRFVRWLSSFEGVMPFRPTQTEHPHINYRHMPIRGLYELRRMVDALQGSLAKVDVSVLLLQGDEDPVVVPRSARLIHDRLTCEDKALEFIASKRHGILHDDIGETRQRIVDFIASR